MLVSFALIGVASLGVALTPPYAAIGVAAPVLVLVWRLLQGFALGGEVGPSTAFLAEAAPPQTSQRTFRMRRSTVMRLSLACGAALAID